MSGVQGRPTPEPPPPDERLSDLLDGRLTPEEETALRAELEADPSLARRLERLRRVAEALRGAPVPEPPAGLARRITASLGRAEGGGVSAAHGGRERLRRLLPMAASLLTAAAFLLLVALLVRDEGRRAAPEGGPGRPGGAVREGEVADLTWEDGGPEQARLGLLREALREAAPVARLSLQGRQDALRVAALLEGLEVARAPGPEGARGEDGAFLLRLRGTREGIDRVARGLAPARAQELQAAAPWALPAPEAWEPLSAQALHRLLREATQPDPRAPAAGERSPQGDDFFRGRASRRSPAPEARDETLRAAVPAAEPPAELYLLLQLPRRDR